MGPAKYYQQFVSLTKANKMEVVDATDIRWRRQVQNVDGYVFGFLQLDDPEEVHPNIWERHLEGDEYLFLINGAVEVIFESPVAENLTLEAENGCVIQQGLWHRLTLIAPSRLLFVSPTKSTERKPVLKDEACHVR
ncbi:hypothetical protein EMM73_19190 [Rheinheimera sediminis]|uniref:hypothetical protein n=1 Tax=Rheinheimera sp. YQF-1 TaxID=2499626 RepID=UPI000FD7D677|nr:hypothetical protein [Rheinheimera sp. YQF-1]RVT41395.1 hypothetical protein EMM73_19190 [Rheinheimera sp. YQF-1]